MVNISVLRAAALAACCVQSGYGHWIQPTHETSALDARGGGKTLVTPKGYVKVPGVVEVLPGYSKIRSATGGSGSATLETSSAGLAIIIGVVGNPSLGFNNNPPVTWDRYMTIINFSPATKKSRKRDLKERTRKKPKAKPASVPTPEESEDEFFDSSEGLGSPEVNAEHAASLALISANGRAEAAEKEAQEQRKLLEKAKEEKNSLTKKHKKVLTELDGQKAELAAARTKLANDKQKKKRQRERARERKKAAQQPPENTEENTEQTPDETPKETPKEAPEETPEEKAEEKEEKATEKEVEEGEEAVSEAEEEVKEDSKKEEEAKEEEQDAEDAEEQAETTSKEADEAAEQAAKEAEAAEQAAREAGKVTAKAQEKVREKDIDQKEIETKVDKYIDEYLRGKKIKGAYVVVATPQDDELTDQQKEVMQHVRKRIGKWVNKPFGPPIELSRKIKYRDAYITTTFEYAEGNMKITAKGEILIDGKKVLKQK